MLTRWSQICVENSFLILSLCLLFICIVFFPVLYLYGIYLLVKMRSNVCSLILLLLFTSCSAGEDAGSLIHTFFRIFHSLISPTGDYEDVIRMKDKFIHEKETGLRTDYDPDSLSYFKIFPKYKTTLSPRTQEEIFGSCFKSIKVSK